MANEWFRGEIKSWQIHGWGKAVSTFATSLHRIGMSFIFLFEVAMKLFVEIKFMTLRIWTTSLRHMSVWFENAINIQIDSIIQTFSHAAVISIREI